MAFLHILQHTLISSPNAHTTIMSRLLLRASRQVALGAGKRRFSIQASAFPSNSVDPSLLWRAEGESKPKEEEEQPDPVETKSGKEDLPNDDKTKGLLFPWRHDAVPIHRVIEGTLEQKTEGHLLTTTDMKPGNVTANSLATAYMFLDVPMYQFFFFGSWKAELADSVSWAMTQAISSLLSKISNVPVADIVKDNYQIDFKGTIHVHDNEDSTIELDGLDSILEKKMIEMYQSSLQKKTGEYEVRLQTLPYSAELISLYCIPYISRQNIRNNKPLLEYYRNMLNKPSMERPPDLNKLRKEHLETGIMESTVIAQVLVWCHEIFYVKDLATGKVVQGEEPTDEEPKSIPHVVRMEMTVKTQKHDGQFANLQDEWLITDIDDLLEGNLVV